VDDEPDPDAAKAAQTMDTLSVTQDGERVAAKVRFDLDLPSAGEDDLMLGEGILLPEWDYRESRLRTGYCCVQPMLARSAEPCALPPHLRRTARRLRNQLAVLAPQRRWLKGQPEGSELDLDACVRAEAERMAGVNRDGAGLYMAQAQQERDLACLILADLSLSTDAWAGGDNKVIDVIRDSLMLLAEALQGTGDVFAMYGFSSLKRSHVRMHELKRFDMAYDAETRGRVAAIEPGYYTRMGAAIRQATRLLEEQPQTQRLLLILSDGKPHDLDLYEGRYGIEDTRKSVMEALDAGIKPFCVTIDKEGAVYLPHLFGAGGYTVVRKPTDLPLQLPRLYTQLTV
jgi:nitric oxide reductase NorD protein